MGAVGRTGRDYQSEGEGEGRGGPTHLSLPHAHEDRAKETAAAPALRVLRCFATFGHSAAYALALCTVAAVCSSCPPNAAAIRKIREIPKKFWIKFELLLDKSSQM